MARIHDAKAGDAILIDGTLHLIRPTDNGTPELVPLADEQAHYALTPEGRAAIAAAAA